jgi:CBS domain containing-hemolysin-like protein
VSSVGALRALPAGPFHRRKLAGELGRYLGAVSILLVGGVHAQQYYDAYFSVVPTIGTLFLLSFIGAGVVGVVLFAPMRLLGNRLGDLILVLAALGGIGIAVGTFVSLLVSEYTPLFGFMESGYRLAIVLAIVFDVLTTLFLGVFVLLIVRARRHHGASTARPTPLTSTTERRSR